MTKEEMIEQLENTILLIKQNGKDWWDERDIPILEAAIKAMKTEPCGDVISRQAVLDKAKYWIAMQETKTGFIEKRGYFVDADDIKALPSVQPEQRWIPVSERLPESDEDVLVTNGIGTYVGWIDPTDNGWRVDSKSKYFMDDILAWMPLPEPFKEESEG